MPRFGSTARFALVAAALLLAACASPPKRAAGPAIDLARYMGTWYVIGHVPYFTDRGQVAARNEYTLRGDGRVGIRYFYRTGFAQPEKMLEASASVQEGSGNRDWKVWFYKVVPANYRVLEVAPDHSWALIDSPGRDLAWVFARTPVMGDAQYQELLQRLRGHGINTDKLWRVPQVREQVGQLGFDRPNDP
jgi:apolipoprotein D and lipocalin family protein